MHEVSKQGLGVGHKHRLILSSLFTVIVMWGSFILQTLCISPLRDRIKRAKPAGSQVQRWVTAWRVQHITVTWMFLLLCFLLPICIWFEFLIMDSSVFAVIFDKTGLNDASQANDTRKNHLSVHYCFFRFLSDWFLLLTVVFSFHYLIKITLLPGLFSTQQLRTDVKALFLYGRCRGQMLIEFVRKEVTQRPNHFFFS